MWIYKCIIQRRNIWRWYFKWLSLRMRPEPCFIFVSTWLMCACQSSFSSIMTPKYFAELTLATSLFDIEILKFSIWFFPEKRMKQDFFILSESLLLISQSSTCFISWLAISSRVLGFSWLRNRDVSSAKRVKENFDEDDGRSLILGHSCH